MQFQDQTNSILHGVTWCFGAGTYKVICKVTPKMSFIMRYISLTYQFDLALGHTGKRFIDYLSNIHIGYLADFFLCCGEYMCPLALCHHKHGLLSTLTTAMEARVTLLMEWNFRVDLSGEAPDSKVPWGQHGAHLGPTGPRWAPCWPHEFCYLR